MFAKVQDVTFLTRNCELSGAEPKLNRVENVLHCVQVIHTNNNRIQFNIICMIQFKVTFLVNQFSNIINIQVHNKKLRPNDTALNNST